MNKFDKIFEYFIEKTENSLFIINSKKQEKYFNLLKHKNNFIFSSDALKDSIKNPYYPFLNKIKNSWENLLEIERDNIIENSKIYYFQKEVFKKYISGEESERLESVQIEEMEYEQSEIYYSLNKILNYDYQETVNGIIFIKNANFLEESSLKFIKWLLEKGNREKFIIVISFDSGLVNKDEDLVLIWDEILEISEEKGLLYSAEDICIENRREDNRVILKETDDTLEEKMFYAIECYNFIAYNECHKIINKINGAIANENISIEIKEKFYIIAANNYKMVKENDKALWYYNFIVESGIDNNNKILLAWAYQNISEVHLIKQNIEMAEKFSEKGLKIAIETGNETLMLKSYFNMFFIKSYISIKEIIKYKHIFEKIEELAIKLKMYNILTRTYGIVVSEYDFYKSNEIRLTTCLNALKIAFKYGNKNRIASLYHNLGVIYRAMEDKEKSLEYYKKSEKLKIKLGIKNEIAKIYNGMGYDLLLTGKFKESLVYFEKALDYLNEERDYGEILLTFYNISILFFMMEQYEKVLYYLKNIINIMKIMKIKKIQFHSQKSIYSLMAIASVKSGKYMKSIEYYNNANSEKELFSEEENIYINIMNGWILNEEKNYKDALAEFEKIEILEKNVVSKILIAKYYYEYELFLKENKKNSDLEKIASTRVLFCTKNGINDFETIFKTSVLKKEDKGFKVREFNIGAIVEFAKQEININTIHKKRAEEKFLIKAQQIFLKNNNSSKLLIENIIKLIKNNFIVEESVLFLLKNGNKIEKYSDDKENDFKKIENFVLELNKNKTSNIFLKETNEMLFNKYKINYSSIITIPIKNNETIMGTIFFGTNNKELILNEEDERLLSIVIQQLSTVLINIELTETLENKNKILLNALEKVKSMENMVSIIHTEKDKQMGINYILNILVNECSFKCKKVFYLNFNESEKALFVAGSSEKSRDIIEAFNSIKIKVDDKNDIALAFSQGIKKEGISNTGIISYLFGIKSFLIIPVSYQFRKYGILLIEKSEEEYDDINLNNDILNIAAANLGVYLENKKFHKEILKSEKLKTVVEFSRAIVHELRTPLSGIKGFAKIEKRRHFNDEKTERHMNEIINGAERIDEMAGELLYYVSEESANQEKVSISKAINIVLKELKNHILSEDIEILLNIQEDINVEFELDQLKKVIKEILKNSIEAAADDSPKIWISAEEIETGIVLLIRDNGIGMDSSEIQYIEEPLSTTKIQGKGMGLPIIKSILRRHNSTIGIESVKGEWTEIKIIIHREEFYNEYNLI
jgi:signal transduction histidine kinase/tetratricopeptide (TPR) repeat protein